MQDDKRLMQHIGNGDHKAMRTLVNMYQDYVFSCCLSLIRDRHLSEEATQDVFVKAYRFASSFRGDARLKTWLYHIVRSTCYDKLRQQKRRSVLNYKDVENEGHVMNDGERWVIQEDRKKLIFELLACLDDRSAEVLSLYYIEEKSIEEVAQTLNLTTSNLKVILFRARKKLRKKMGVSTLDKKKDNAKTGKF